MSSLYTAFHLHYFLTFLQYKYTIVETIVKGVLRVCLRVAEEGLDPLIEGFEVVVIEALGARDEPEDDAALQGAVDFQTRHYSCLRSLLISS